MVVRTHGDFHAVHLVFDVVVERVDQDEQVVPAHSLFDDGFGFTRGEAGSRVLDEERFFRIPFDADVGVFRERFLTPFDDVFVDFGSDLFRSFHCDDAEFAERIRHVIGMFRDVGSH